MNRLEKSKEYTKHITQGNDEFDQEFHDLMDSYIYGDVYQHGSLDMETRQIVTLVTLTTNYNLKELKKQIELALAYEVSPIMMKEAIYQCTPYIGLGKVNEALDVMNEVFNAKGVKQPLVSQATVNEETRWQKGFDVQTTSFSKETIQRNHDNAPKELKHIQDYLSAYCFGDFYTRNGLDLAMRELITMVMIATLGGCENQLRGHVGANIRVGNSREKLIEVMTQCQPYIGFPRTLNAIAIINEITLNKG